MEQLKKHSNDGDKLVPIRLRKAIMRVGEFQTPDGARFTIDKTRLDHWVRTFCNMSKNGDVCRIVKDHDEGVMSSVGKVVGMERRGDYLYATLEFPTRELAALSSTNDVSIFSEPVYRTGSGTYKDAIKHVSLTPFPLISKLGSFKKLPDNVPLVCSINSFVKPQKGQVTMDESLNQVVELIANFIGLEIPDVARQSNEAAIAWISAILQGANSANPKPEENQEEKPESEDKQDSTDADDTDDSDNLPENADAIIASVNGARSTVLNSFIGFPGITAQQVGKWVGKFAKCKSLKKQAATNSEFDTLVEGLRCSCNGKKNVVDSGRQFNSNANSVKIPAFEKLMALRK